MSKPELHWMSEKNEPSANWRAATMLPPMGFGTPAWSWKAGQVKPLSRVLRRGSAIPRLSVFTWRVSTSKAEMDWGFNPVQGASRG